MSTTSPFIKMVLQALDENPDTWGSVLNVSALELLEDAIAGTAVVTFISSADYTLNDDTGGPTATDGSRYMILNIAGSPGAAANVIVPARSKIYLAVNNTSDSSTITVKTSAGTGIAVSPGVAIWVFCDGTNVEAASVDAAQTALTASTATDATNLGGTPAASFAKLATAQTWSKGQVVERAAALTPVTTTITPNLANSNSFYALWDGNYTLAVPSGTPVNGQQFSIVIQQDNPAGPNTISFGAGYAFEGGTPPTLSTTASAVDYLGFEYVANGINKWIGSILKDIS